MNIETDADLTVILSGSVGLCLTLQLGWGVEDLCSRLDLLSVGRTCNLSPRSRLSYQPGDCASITELLS